MMEKIIQKCLPTYRVVGKLGEGLYGCVYHIKDRFKERAVKVVPIVVERSLTHRTPEELDSKISRDFHSVRAYYDTVKGKGVIDIYDFHLIDKQVSVQNASAYLVILMELYPENLHDHVLDHYPLPSDKALFLTKGLAETLERLSAPENDAFLVTDLKPSNLLLSRDGRVLIGDLGGLKRLGSVSTAASAQFSPSWCAPEILFRGEAPGIETAVYAFGLVAYFIWEGHLPHEDQDFSQRPRLIRDKGLVFTGPHVPGRIKALIRKCLAFEPKHRLKDFRGIMACFQDTIPTDSVDPTVGPDAAETLAPPSAYPGADRSGGRDRSGTTGPAPKPRSRETWTDPKTGMVFVRVPEGLFEMGGLGGDDGADDHEYPAQPVTVENFWMGKFPVTQSEWKAVMGNNPSHFQQDQKNPVEQVSWKDAVTFLKKLYILHGGRYKFWLPSETQWEFAARSGGMAEPYSGGSEVEPFAWYRDNSGYNTHPVGKKAPNGLGIHDMSGNVLEWCADVYGPEACGRMQDHSWGGNSRSGLNRVVRGGSWTHAAHRCRTTYRWGLSAGLCYTSLGFRVVRHV